MLLFLELIESKAKREIKLQNKFVHEHLLALNLIL